MIVQIIWTLIQFYVKRIDLKLKQIIKLNSTSADPTRVNRL